MASVQTTWTRALARQQGPGWHTRIDTLSTTETAYSDAFPVSLPSKVTMGFYSADGANLPGITAVFLQGGYITTNSADTVTEVWSTVSTPIAAAAQGASLIVKHLDFDTFPATRYRFGITQASSTQAAADFNILTLSYMNPGVSQK